VCVCVCLIHQQGLPDVWKQKFPQSSQHVSTRHLPSHINPRLADHLHEDQSSGLCMPKRRKTSQPKFRSLPRNFRIEPGDRFYSYRGKRKKKGYRGGKSQVFHNSDLQPFVLWDFLLHHILILHSHLIYLSPKSPLKSTYVY